MYANTTLVGRLIGDPELRTVDSGNGPQMKATGCLSINRPYKKKDSQYPESDLFNFEVWGKQAESLTNSTRKGDHLVIAGWPEFYEDKQGAKRLVIRNATWRYAGMRIPTEGRVSVTSSYSELDDIGF